MKLKCHRQTPPRFSSSHFAAWECFGAPSKFTVSIWLVQCPFDIYGVSQGPLQGIGGTVKSMNWEYHNPGKHLYVFDCIHLRDDPSVKPAIKEDPDDTHEVQCWRIEDDARVPLDWSNSYRMPNTFMILSAQFKANDDGHANQVVENLIKSFVENENVPFPFFNKDFRARLHHIAAGGNPMEVSA